MISRLNAGLLMYRFKNGSLQIFLAHPGGPLFPKKDDGYWTIPKGEPPAGERLMETAIREFEEETGLKPNGPNIELGWIIQKGGKTVHGWAFEGDHDPAQPIQSIGFELEWPPKSGRVQCFPEVDRAQFFALSEGRKKLKGT